MKIETLASGSTGNAYLVSDEHTTLLLECGLRYKELMRRSAYRLSSVDACLITHEHGDHAKAVKDLMGIAIPVYCSAGTAKQLCITDLKKMKHLEPAVVGSMRILPFAIKHDAAEPLGWLIASDANGETLCFITDAACAPFRFPSLDYIMIECNHMGAESMQDTNAFLADRVLHNHLSLQDCIDFLRHQDLSCAQEIILLHISNRHGDPEMMQKAVQAATGKRVVIAQYRPIR